MSLRVLMVVNTLPPDDLSGVGEQVLQLAAGLRRAGHQVEVLGRAPGGAKLWFPLAVLPRFLRALARLRPHVVQVHESDGALAALAAAVVAPLASPRPLVAALLQVSYVEELKAVRPLSAGGRVLGRPGAEERRFRWLKAPLHIILGCLTAWVSDVVLSPSRRTAREVARDYGVAEPEVVPNVTAAVAERSGRGEAAERGYFLFVGRLRIRKGVEVLLEALRDPGWERPPPPLWLAGDGEHREALERAAAGPGRPVAARFLGRCDRTRVRQLLDGCLALVVPSIYEGMPLVVLEAMERAAPVVASAVSGIPEVVVDGETGWLVPAEDPAALAAVLREAAAAPAEAKRRGEAGRQRLERRYRPRHAVAAWEGAIRGRLEEATG